MKKNFSRGLAGLALTTAAAFALSACAMTMPMGGMGGTGEGDQNAADVMFVQMMIPHHEQAVEMSEIILDKEGVDSEVVGLAEQIRAAQDPEIDLMEQWLEDWGLPSMGGMGGMDHGGMDHGGMDGMMSEEQMVELQSADGATGAALFLELMIEHHVGAVEMADQVIDDGRDADVRALAEEMIVGQTAEITTMRELLAR
jgi:uncharacterized protein (DUF305 family)